ncbi:hypothetical protein [Pseudonocardia sp. H11422]|uniref:Rv2732c family membrane protein n=1 Tax=Pseudonocardia sp. H11422 TaxID=2835866 RepID=UPI001BDD02E2|nr:hypothetical protein [Pseudonocardia sp. H11422]
MSESPAPDELSRLDAELAGVARRVERRIDPGATAMVVSVAVLVLIGALLLPWTGSARGWEILVGAERLGLLPQLFTVTAVGFGVVGSTLALATRRWGLAWLCAVGCGISVINGVWAIWSRQIGVPEGASGPGPGLILAVVAVLTLAVSWARIALRR